MVGWERMKAIAVWGKVWSLLSDDQCQGHIYKAHKNQNTVLQRESRVLSTIPVGSREETEWMERAHDGPGSHEIGW